MFWLESDRVIHIWWVDSLLNWLLFQFHQKYDESRNSPSQLILWLYSVIFWDLKYSSREMFWGDVYCEHMRDIFGANRNTTPSATALSQIQKVLLALSEWHSSISHSCSHSKIPGSLDNISRAISYFGPTSESTHLPYSTHLGNSSRLETSSLYPPIRSWIPPESPTCSDLKIN